MNIVYLLLGSNLNDRSAMLQRARKEIASRIGLIIGESSVYESEPWGFTADKSFLNQVISIESGLDPNGILNKILQIELDLGRIRVNGERYSSRIIDIDILFFNDEIIAEKNLIIPHPGIPERLFALIPLSELDGTFIHPGSRKSINELISECPDKLRVCPYHPS
jgi:2-amino-4-hydroxy-6-hydroxymethyldihydropteridine diphosphokinase